MSESPTHPYGWRPTWIASDRRLARSVALPVSRFLHLEASSGILLVVAAVIALVWANSPWADSYTDLLHAEIGVQIGAWGLHESLQHWVNDGLMAIFFFIAGLEIKRELVVGELRNPRAAALPIIGAMGGMLAPALIYVAFNVGGPGAGGWGIPMATDIAFAVGVVTLLGDRVPASMRLFLLSLAIVDDLGGIVVIALFYSSGISLGWLGTAVALFVVVYALRRVHVWYLPVYLVLGSFAWYATLESGVHATIAGVVLGLLAPTEALRPSGDAASIAHQLDDREVTAAEVARASFLIQETVPVGERLSNRLHPWTAFMIVPLFALVNAGIPLSAEAVGRAVSSPVTLGVALGLVVGKTLGIFTFSMVATRARVAVLPEGVKPLHVLGVAAVGGVGFTVAMFVTEIAFTSPALKDEAKIGILVASFAAAILGSLILGLAWRRHHVTETLEEAESAVERLGAEWDHRHDDTGATIGGS